jgi:FtsH-binding integral membrane protein
MVRPQSTAKVAKAINIYLDIVQLFLFLLQLLGERK